MLKFTELYARREEINHGNLLITLLKLPLIKRDIKKLKEMYETPFMKRLL